MKVVLFCGGFGMRLRDGAENTPKPMVNIGYRPILWHIMKYYAHYGHKDFILCLGYKGDMIKRYFLDYDETLSNNFVLTEGGRQIQLLNSDIHDWRITFVDTGLRANIGQRLKAVEPYLADDDIFMANYSDGLTDLDLNAYLEHFRKSGKIGSFVAVKPNSSFHVVSMDSQGLVGSIRDISRSGIRINGGFFAFRREIFDYIYEGEELVYEPFQRLIERKQLLAYSYDGFWACMDTFKEKQQLEDMYTSGNAAWEVWKKPSPVAETR